ncbi:MAG: phosphatidate cytidylyltransferase [Lachnospiraceae bacterium]|nr:phosphatidate cytidylyltransferase [Lachnospiraceae bacterium]
MFYKRALSAVMLVVIALAVILTGGAVLAVVLYMLSLIAFFELTKAIGVHEKDKKINALETAGVLGITIYYLAMFFAKTETAMCFALILTFMAIMFVYVFAFPKFKSGEVMGTFFCVVYAPALLSFLYLTRNLKHGIYVVWLIFISSWICDTCAYLVGVMIGKHKMAPKLSPKKSIEGAIGGIAGSSLVGALFGLYVERYVLTGEELVLVFAIIGAVGAMISQVGDLAASAIKRNHDIKDYGKLIPGHGGVMDRFDSVLFAAPMIYFLAYFLMNQL